MSWKRLFMVMLVVTLSIALLAPVADAKKKKSKKSKSKKSSKKSSKSVSREETFQIGADLGANVFSFLPFGTVTSNPGTDNEVSGDLSGTGGFGPLFGAHFHLFFAEWIVRAEFAYAYQGGQGTVSWDDTQITNSAGVKTSLKDLDFDWSMNNVKLGAGFGKVLVKHRIVRPYLLGVVDYHYLTFKDKDAEDSGTGSGLGLGGLLGVDAKIPGAKGFYAGGGLRFDIIYTVNDLEQKFRGGKNTYSFMYLPVAIFLTGGYQF